MDDIADYYEDKVVLITGGAGSIGSELVQAILGLNPHVVRILDNNETGLFWLEQQLQSDKIRTFLGDIRDEKRLSRAIEGVDIVFHAAALKHVPLCEFNPFEAAKTNVCGTQNVIDVSLDEGVEKFILISTDKAVNPTNVMGATKLVAERLVLSANLYKGDRKTALSCVRFGNVLGTSGSVLPLFKSQIEGGGPLKVTDRRMTRFFMRISEAVQLILEAGRLAEGGEVYILKMPAVNILDLALALRARMVARKECEPGEIVIEEIGKRRGEKLYEELLTDEDVEYTKDNGPFLIIDTNALSEGQLGTHSYTSDSAKKLTIDQISQILEEVGY
jgi:FlaA1/EpsC-like NDP-sugar epimerase